MMNHNNGKLQPQVAVWWYGDEQAKFYALVLADTLAYLHSKLCVYRDLKPENVLLNEYGYPILVDFGYAKPLETTEMIFGDDDDDNDAAAAAAAANLFRTFTFCGTPNYMAPEMIHKEETGHHWGVDVLS
jgi:serine/threonine protein kinase